MIVESYRGSIGKLSTIPPPGQPGSPNPGRPGQTAGVDAVRRGRPGSRVKLSVAVASGALLGTDALARPGVARARVAKSPG